MVALIDARHGPLTIAVKFYDGAERESLLGYPTAQRMLELVENGATVPMAQFLTYYLFHKRRPGKAGYRNYRELESKVERAIVDLDDWVKWKDGSLSSAEDALPQDRAVVERIGEAAALSLVGQIHGLHEADWAHIPERGGRRGYPTCDYSLPERASDGSRVIQVEAKGSAVPDAGELSANIRAQKHRLDEKKARIRALEADGKYPHPADLRYGVVAALGQTSPLTCWLIDPPGEEAPDPRVYRLLARLQFVFEWISFLVPRSQLAASFATRLSALYALQEPWQLARLPLRRGSGAPFEWQELVFTGRRSLLNHLSWVADGSATGAILEYDGERLVFVGIKMDLLRIAVEQEFDELVAYKAAPASRNDIVRCILPGGRARRMGVRSPDPAFAPDGESYVDFYASGTLHYGSGGSVFGLLEIRGGRRRGR